MLTDHLNAVCAAAQRLVRGETQYASRVVQACRAGDLKLDWAEDILSSAALLHDIGKTLEFEKNHPNWGQEAAEEILTEDPDAAFVGRLVRYHDLPWAWWRSLQKNQQRPRSRAWRRLDNTKLNSDEPGVGTMLLCMLTMADTHGHSGAEDSAWFVENANRYVLEPFGRPLPVPTEDEVFELLPPEMRLKGDW